MGSHPQKGHGSKRPRRFHHGRAEGRRALPKLDLLDQAEQRAVVVDAELVAELRQHRDDVKVWRALDRAAPFVPRVEAGW